MGFFVWKLFHLLVNSFFNFLVSILISLLLIWLKLFPHFYFNLPLLFPSTMTIISTESRNMLSNLLALLLHHFHFLVIPFLLRVLLLISSLFVTFSSCSFSYLFFSCAFLQFLLWSLCVQTLITIRKRAMCLLYELYCTNIA